MRHTWTWIGQAPYGDLYRCSRCGADPENDPDTPCTADPEDC